VRDGYAKPGQYFNETIVPILTATEAGYGGTKPLLDGLSRSADHSRSN